MNEIINKIVGFIKKETVLTVAWVLAIISAFIITPSISYVNYIDFRSLGILWCLMIVMAGLKERGFFKYIGNALLKKTSKVWQLCLVLILLCFFLSMFITNDVALITFVPFSIFVLNECKRENLLIPTIVLQTLAANLGSMLTPIGNPQNLYLYGLAGMSLGEFVGIMLPYSALTLVLLLISILFIDGRSEKIACENLEAIVYEKKDKSICIAYGILFIGALLVVLRFVPYWAIMILVLVVVFIMDRKILLSIDYALLFTFIGFFIFTGNLGNIEAVKNVLTEAINGHEVIMGVGASQIISNVPAALLLSPFTDNYRSLIIGVNLGGMGTLIASMASLISFKALAHNYNHLKGRYFALFTVVNIVYLCVLMGMWMIIS